MCSILQAAGALAPEQLRKVTDNFETTKFFGEFLTKFCFLAANQLPGFIVLTLLQALRAGWFPKAGAKVRTFLIPSKFFDNFFQKNFADPEHLQKIRQKINTRKLAIELKETRFCKANRAQARDTKTKEKSHNKYERMWHK